MAQISSKSEREAPVKEIGSATSANSRAGGIADLAAKSCQPTQAAATKIRYAAAGMAPAQGD